MAKSLDYLQIAVQQQRTLVYTCNEHLLVSTLAY